MQIIIICQLVTVLALLNLYVVCGRTMIQLFKYVFDDLCFDLVWSTCECVICLVLTLFGSLDVQIQELYSSDHLTTLLSCTLDAIKASAGQSYKGECPKREVRQKEDIFPASWRRVEDGEQTNGCLELCPMNRIAARNEL